MRADRTSSESALSAHMRNRLPVSFGSGGTVPVRNGSVSHPPVAVGMDIRSRCVLQTRGGWVAYTRHLMTEETPVWCVACNSKNKHRKFGIIFPQQLERSRRDRGLSNWQDLGVGISFTNDNENNKLFHYLVSQNDNAKVKLR